MEYEKKTYKSFVVGMILFGISFMLPICLMGKISADIIIRMMYLISFSYMAMLGKVIYKHQRIYWLSSYTYEMAKKMDPKRRELIAENFMILTLKVFLIFVVYCMLATLFIASFILDTITIILLIGFACMCKLEEKPKFK